MGYRVGCLLNERIDLLKYGSTVRSILSSPLIGSTLSPESKYDSYKKQLVVEFEIDPQQAIDLNEAAYFQLLLHHFLKAIENMERPQDFDFEAFRSDVQQLKFEQLPVVA